MNASQTGVYERLVWLYNNGSFNKREALSAAHWCGQTGDVLEELIAFGLLVPVRQQQFVVVTPIQTRILEELVQQFGGAQFTWDDALTVALWTGGSAATVEQLIQRGRLKDQGHEVLQISTLEELGLVSDEIELEDPIEASAIEEDGPGEISFS